MSLVRARRWLCILLSLWHCPHSILNLLSCVDVFWWKESFLSPYIIECSLFPLRILFFKLLLDAYGSPDLSYLRIPWHFDFGKVLDIRLISLHVLSESPFSSYDIRASCVIPLMRLIFIFNIDLTLVEHDAGSNFALIYGDRIISCNFIIIWLIVIVFKVVWGAHYGARHVSKLRLSQSQLYFLVMLSVHKLYFLLYFKSILGLPRVLRR